MNVTLELPDDLPVRLEQRVTASVVAQLGREFAARWLRSTVPRTISPRPEAFASDLTFEQAVRLD